MAPSYHPLERSERLIALGRAALAGFSLLAVWLDPTTPTRHVAAAYALLSAYLVYALLLVLVTWGLARLPSRFGLATHLIDLPAFTALLYLTEGPTSPLFVYFVFALLSAALRWSWRGVLWTAAATLAAFFGLGAYAEWVLRDPAFELNRFILRTVHLVTLAVLLGYLSAHQQRLREELARLAAWPRGNPPGLPVEQALRHAADILGAPRALMVWEEADEPWRYVAAYADGTFRSSREPLAIPEPPVAGALADADFLCPDAGGPRPRVLRTSPAGGGLERWQGAPLPAGLRERFAIGPVLCLRLRAEKLDGRLFFLDMPRMTSDDLILGGIVARQVAADLDQFYLQQRLQQTAIAEERARFARDLHDGVLQSLAGLALQLKAVRSLLDTDPQAARRRLADIQDQIAAEQRDLRFFVRQLKPVPLSRIEPNAGLAAYLEELAQRTERQWGLRVELTVAPMARQIPDTIAHEVYRVVQEALANAARHGGASLARVRLGLRGDDLDLTVADDGRGLDFRGRRDLAALTLGQTGPVSLRERIAALGGNLVIDSTESGARLEILLPLAGDRREPSDPAGPRPAPGGGAVGPKG